MINLQEIKKELKEISPWPWSSTTGRENFVHAHPNGFVCESRNYSGDKDVDFIAKAPERISQMIETIERQDKLIKKSKPIISKYLEFGCHSACTAITDDEDYSLDKCDCGYREAEQWLASCDEEEK